MKKVDLYTDGSSRGNPGPGGYGAVLSFTDGAGRVHEREMSRGYAQTTNNRMELMGVIVGLEALTEPCEVTVHTDSKYIANAFNEGWLDNWLARNWKTAAGKPVKNKDLWQRLVSASKEHAVTYEWVKGHAGHEMNERCDDLATSAADGEAGPLDSDDGFM